MQHSHLIQSNIQGRGLSRAAILVESVIAVWIPRTPPPVGILVSIAILDLVVFLFMLVTPGAHGIIVSRSEIVSLICLGLGLGAAYPEP